jgi:hypothetical protein
VFWRDCLVASPATLRGARSLPCLARVMRCATGECVYRVAPDNIPVDYGCNVTSTVVDDELLTVAVCPLGTMLLRTKLTTGCVGAVVVVCPLLRWRQPHTMLDCANGVVALSVDRRTVVVLDAASASRMLILELHRAHPRGEYVYAMATTIGALSIVDGLLVVLMRSTAGTYYSTRRDFESTHNITWCLIYDIVSGHLQHESMLSGVAHV